MEKSLSQPPFLHLSICLLAGLSFSSYFAPSTFAQLAPSRQPARGSQLEDVEYGACQWKEGFWKERQSVCFEKSIPAMWEIMTDDRRSQFLTNFKIANGQMQGKHRGPSWNDGDFYKWIEAASVACFLRPDEELSQHLDSVIEVIGKAQAPNGYIHTPVQIRRLAGDEKAIPFSEPLQFELYNFGHLLTAAVVHHRSTGKTTLLNIAIRAAEYLDRTFHGPESPLTRSAICPSHYMGLIELGRHTGRKEWIDLAKELIDKRDQVIDGTDDNQDRLPFREQTSAVGHAVRANYLYAGVCDLALETGDLTLRPVLEKLWEDVATRKVYVTGACGALFDGASPDGSSAQKIISRTHQAYGRPYQLPNSTAHNESCATIGNLLWNWRMLKLTGESRYADMFERSLYNGLLATVSLDGTSYFYTNTLRQLDTMPVDLRWSRTREPFISCYCCPPNILRTIARSHEYAYSKSRDSVHVHLYGSNHLQTRLENGIEVAIEQTTQYPWNGNVRLEVREVKGNKDQAWTLYCRLPGWCPKASWKINGEPLTKVATEKGYVAFTRKWKSGDRIEIEFEMPSQWLESHPLVEENRNQIALQRGPLVYCIESKDIPSDTSLLDLRIPLAAKLEPALKADLNRIIVLRGEAIQSTTDKWSGTLYREVNPKPAKHISIEWIPYYAWGNRGKSEMSVWMPIDSTIRK